MKLICYEGEGLFAFFCLLLLTNIIKRDSYESSRTSMEGCYGLTYPYPKECKVILTMIDDRAGNVVILASLKVSVSNGNCLKVYCMSAFVSSIG